MDQEAILKLLGSFYDKLVTDVSERVIDRLVRDGALTTEVNTRVQDELDRRAMDMGMHKVTREAIVGLLKEQLDDFSDRMAMLDRSAIEDVVTAHLEDLEVVTQQDLKGYVEEVVEAADIDDRINSFMLNHFDISDYQSDIVDIIDERLDGEVLELVKNLTFTVEVS